MNHSTREHGYTNLYIKMKNGLELNVKSPLKYNEPEDFQNIKRGRRYTLRELWLWEN